MKPTVNVPLTKMNLHEKSSNSIRENEFSFMSEAIGNSVNKKYTDALSGFFQCSPHNCFLHRPGSND